MLVLALSAAADPGILGYYADPDVHGATVVFCSEGDLWTVPLTGGLAARLTSGVGEESHPRFSPDGSSIAYTASYDGGNADVFVIPTGGGVPRRLTWHPAADAVNGWTPDGKQILYASSRDEPLARDRMWSVPAVGGDSALLPLGLATQLDLKADSHFVAFVPYALRDLNTLRYQGGAAADLYLGDLVSRVYRRLTTWTGSDHTPMWQGETLYFLSDRAGLMDLWSVRGDGTGLAAHTHHDDFPLKDAAIGGDTIVYTQGADLWRYDTRARVAARIPVRLQSDQQRRRPQVVEAAALIAGLSPLPGADRVVVEARGRLISVPASGGRTIEVGRLPGRNRGVAVSPDGTRVAAWNDGAGDEQLVLYDAAGVAAPVVVPGTAGPWHFPPVWSPAGDALAWGDATGRLSVFDVRAGSVAAVDQDRHLEIDHYTFSPDGAWIAWVRTAPNGNGVVWVKNRLTGAPVPVTDPDYHSFAPAWDPAGHHLYFLSARTFDPLVSGDDSSPLYASGPAQDYPEFGSFLTDMALPYAILLDDRAWSPVLAPDPLRTPPPAPVPTGRRGARIRAAEPTEEQVRVTIDLDGIVARTVAIPLEPGNYTELVATADAVWALARPPLRLSDVNGDIANRPGTLVGWSLTDREPLTGPSEVEDVTASADGGTVVIRTTSGVTVGETASLGDDEAIPLDLSSLPRLVDLGTEWTAIFEDSWRAYRDFFWSPGMVGVDWSQKRAQYRPLAARVGSREELNHVVGEMIAELGNPHAYSWGGDGPVPDRAPTGMLGADLVTTPAGLRITRIYPGANWDPTAASPLAAPGLGIREGDVIVAVDGVPVAGGPVDPLAWFAGKADADVALRVARGPKDPVRDVVVHTLSDDTEVRHRDWVARNRAWVAEHSAGSIGYLHVRDMMGDGFADFTRGWFAQSDRSGFVLDLRNNGGGYVSQLMLERIRRRLTGIIQGRTPEQQDSDTWRAFPGPLVVLVDAGTASDGEGFTNVFQTLKLGSVLGTRTWGGLVGYRVARTVVDGGFRSEPEYGSYGMSGKWAVEGHGIDPDVVVENDPSSLAAGRDLQLEAAVAQLVGQLRANPVPAPRAPPYPELSLEAWRRAHPVQTVP